ncbi:alkaline phosphatase D family protein [Spongiactinospora sp. TRM90649]|uniref:alkaline phosphatase D family protein n=1 Tax=Spongiactinospora sp. TRM90649 TaxID=3031114 RepID=UPI0023F8FCC5|nr:alkaline phosphatase D family protein [Spongiactinospora sp. TRM90649]MDF5754143.1 alkaline phosphatase D family protein [Spongiactinospora sp. TRM90649]
MTELLVGPMLRYVDTTSASVWVETAAPGRVAVEAGGVRVESATFTVHGHHFALCDLVWPEPPEGGVPYTVEVDGERVWPPEGGPPSRIRLLPASGPREVLFGSCRTSVPHDAAHNLSHGVDMLREYGRRLRDAPDAEWPGLLLLLGDQVYADAPGGAVLDAIRARRGGEEPVDEIADFEEYAELYRQAWSEPEIRWLLATLPTAMIFDDHDLRDDWNTSAAWRERMSELPWWRRRLVAGLGAYWVYQHLGNLSPGERAADPLLNELRGHEGDGGALLDAFAERADREPDATRWSYARDLGDTRLIMLDTRCARRLTPGDRRMIDDVEWAWFAGQMDADARHIVIGSSIPVLLPSGIHHAESWNEALCDGAWGPRVARWSERLRQAVDLEHWAAFRRSFAGVCRSMAAARGTVIVLSGDVHYSYLAKARGLPIYQLVCSPIRNPLSPVLRLANVVASVWLAGLVGGLLARLAGVPRPPFRWRLREGPWFSNAVATLTLGEVATVRWDGPGRTARLSPNEDR